MAKSEAAAVWVDVADLKPWAQNPRDNAKAVAKVAASIKRFGFAAPIIARAENREVIAGHTRLEAAASLGMIEVPCRFMSGLSDAEAHALALADNRVGEEADWDESLLADVLRGIEAAGSVLGGLGFDQDELDGLLADAPQIEVEEVNTSAVKDEFWLSIRGPLPTQPDALELLRAALEQLPGVTVHVGTTKAD